MIIQQKKKKKKSLHDKKNIRVCDPMLRSKEDCGP